ncbi:hypothetical protein C8E87_7046 [Paractinoplanes brasiliensis]|uniref:Uncharacterized protein n=1 Tax=Paractinoplanes brasiliensis TaxID=52695 RepID=A0A4R6J7V5_9ACTN|nr:hypothetical protein C8E87_7046 [Actinoplanes brasiliensis]
MTPDAEFTNSEGRTFTVSKNESYIIYTHGETGMVVDKTEGGYHTVDFDSEAERDRALRHIRGDHPVYDRDDPDVQLNPAAPNYRRGR